MQNSKIKKGCLEKNTGVDVVELQDNTLTVAQDSHMGSVLFPGWFTFDPNPCLWPGNAAEEPQYLCERSRSSRMLTLAQLWLLWPSRE